MKAKCHNLAETILGPRLFQKYLHGVINLAALAVVTAALGFCTSINAALAAPLLPVPVSTSPSNGDLNPYGVLFVQGFLGGTLQPGDVLVSNFNNSDNVMFLGTTIVDIRNGAQTAAPFYTSSTAGEGLSLALGQLGNFIIVGNVPTVAGTAGPGALTVLNGNGVVLNTLTDPKATFIDGPWGLAINQRPWGWSPGQRFTGAQIFVSNALNGTVWRLDVLVDEDGVTINDEVRVGSGYLKQLTFPSVINGPAGLAYDAKHDILYVASELDNEIFAVVGASTISSDQSKPGTVVYSDDTHLHGPTGLLLLNNGDLLTANDDGVNVNAADPSELVEFAPSTSGGRFVTQYSVDPANGGAFGIATATNGPQTLLAYVDDNQATLSILSLFTGFPI
jgi:hypothetical protein